MIIEKLGRGESAVRLRAVDWTAKLVHQPRSQSADDEDEHRIEHNEPDRRSCDGRPMRFESH